MTPIVCVVNMQKKKGWLLGEGSSAGCSQKIIVGPCGGKKGLHYRKLGSKSKPSQASHRRGDEAKMGNNDPNSCQSKDPSMFHIARLLSLRKGVPVDEASKTDCLLPSLQLRQEFLRACLIR